MKIISKALFSISLVSCFLLASLIANGEEETVFHLHLNSLEDSGLHFEDAGNWRLDDGALIYTRNNGHPVCATLALEEMDYQLDAEFTIDPRAEKKAGLRNSSHRRVGFTFRKGESAAAEFYILHRCLDSRSNEMWTAVGDLPGTGRLGGRYSVAALSVDDASGKHHIRAMVQGDLANFYVDGKLLCIMDSMGLKGAELGLHVQGYALIHSFSVSKLKRATTLHTKRAGRLHLLQEDFVLTENESPKARIERAGKVLDDAIKKGSPGIANMENMPHYTYCCLTYRDTRKNALSFPAFHHPLIMRALLKYHEYTNDAKYLKAACQLADWNMAHSTPPDCALPNMPYSTTCNGKMGGFVDGDAIMLDKSGMMGQAYLWLYSITKEKKYLDAAGKIGTTLLKAQLPEGRWQNRVSPTDLKVVQDYTSNQIFNIILMDQLYEATSDNRYRESSKRALAWLLANPVKDYRWFGFYEDVKPYEVSVGNWDAITTARYLVAHSKENPEYLRVAKDITEWVFFSFTVKQDNVWPTICEQTICMTPMSCHTFNYAVLLSDLYGVTGEERYKKEAIAYAKAGFAISRDQDDRGWYSLITSALYHGVDLVQKLGL
jgi:Beta-L-arabinofuranosidase, GH127 catalytic domain